MYQNVGQKIKNLTKVVVIIMMVLSVIGGISMMALDEEMILPGLLIAPCMLTATLLTISSPSISSWPI